MAYAIDGCVGINYERIDVNPQFTLGHSSRGSDNKLYTYVQAGGAIAASQTDITVSTAFQATDGSGTNIGPATAVANDEYFWVSNATNWVDQE